MRVLVTGANGFVGRNVVNRLNGESGLEVRRAVRATVDDASTIAVGEIGPETNWREALHGVDVVVHTAARVHQMHDTAADPLAAFRRVNSLGTAALARQAAAAGAKRLVLLSSIKVLGDRTDPGRPFEPTDPPSPSDPYGISKLEAEQELHRVARETGLEAVVIRPVLVYGPGVRANFAAMMRIVWRRIPLPFARLNNRRSLVAIENLSSLIARCITHPSATNSTLLVSDGEDLSTSELLRRIARAMGRPSRLFSVPPSLLAGAATALGRRSAADRLLGSLQVDISDTKRRLDWLPPVSVDDALQATVDDFLRRGGER